MYIQWTITLRTWCYNSPKSSRSQTCITSLIKTALDVHQLEHIPSKPWCRLPHDIQLTALLRNILNHGNHLHVPHPPTYHFCKIVPKQKWGPACSPMHALILGMTILELRIKPEMSLAVGYPHRRKSESQCWHITLSGIQGIEKRELIQGQTLLNPNKFEYRQVVSM